MYLYGLPDVFGFQGLSEFSTLYMGFKAYKAKLVVCRFCGLRQLLVVTNQPILQKTSDGATV